MEGPKSRNRTTTPTRLGAVNVEKTPKERGTSVTELVEVPAQNSPYRYPVQKRQHGDRDAAAVDALVLVPILPLIKADSTAAAKARGPVLAPRAPSSFATAPWAGMLAAGPAWRGAGP